MNEKKDNNKHMYGKHIWSRKKQMNEKKHSKQKKTDARNITHVNEKQNDEHNK